MRTESIRIIRKDGSRYLNRQQWRRFAIEAGVTLILTTIDGLLPWMATYK